VGVVVLACGGAAQAQSMLPGGMPPPPGMSLDRSAAMRFPQPARVSALLRRDVLQPVPSQRVLGTVKSVVRDESGTVEAVVEYGGFLGFGARPIAVPIDAMVLVGQDMEIVAFSPKELNRFPTFSTVGTTPLPSDTIIRVGLAKPSH
jgi:PRC-barrel domain